MVSKADVKEYAPNVVALWEIFKELVPPAPPKIVEPYVWKGKQIIEKLYEVAEDFKLGRLHEVERRVLVLANPGLKKFGQYTATHTLYAGFQIVLPGEVAEAHRHSPFAARFMISGKASTVVDGSRYIFEPGDFITTPRWSWHDHDNQSSEPAIWLDLLDIPIPKMLLASFFEEFKKGRQPAFEEGDVRVRMAHTGLTPRFDLRWQQGHSTPLLFKWKQTYSILRDLANFTEGNPYEGIVLTYRDNATGKEVSETMGADIILLKPGMTTKVHRHTMSVVYYVIDGSGVINIEGERFPWERHDVIALPPWSFHSFENEGEREAILFSVNDRPLLQSLGLYREEAL